MKSIRPEGDPLFIPCGLCGVDTYFTYISGEECQVCSNGECPMIGVAFSARKHFEMIDYIASKVVPKYKRS